MEVVREGKRDKMRCDEMRKENGKGKERRGMKWREEDVM